MVEKRPNRTLGPGHDQFWEWCGRGELRLQQCERCSTLAWPVTEACADCGGDRFAWVAMSGRGRVVSWCSFERDYYADALPLPWDAILVELAEGPLFLSNPQGFNWTEVEPGMAVEVVFLDCEDDSGPFRLPVFRGAQTDRAGRENSPETAERKGLR
jgi:uncharacterized OB-fold protein